MDPLQKFPQLRQARVRRHFLRAPEQLPQIRASAKSRSQLAMDDQRMRRAENRLELGNKPFKFHQRFRANLVVRRPVQRQFDATVAQSPRHRRGAKISHPVFFRKSSSIGSRSLSLIASRFSLPLAVSNPFSIENGSAEMQNARIRR